MSLSGIPPVEVLVRAEPFRDTVIRALHKPKNAIGLRGPGRGLDRWDKWFRRFFEAKITKKYYRGRKELCSKDAEIAVRQEVVSLATAERRKLRIFQEILGRRPASNVIGMGSSFPGLGDKNSVVIESSGDSSGGTPMPPTKREREGRSMRSRRPSPVVIEVSDDSLDDIPIKQLRERQRTRSCRPNQTASQPSDNPPEGTAIPSVKKEEVPWDMGSLTVDQNPSFTKPIHPEATRQLVLEIDAGNDRDWDFVSRSARQNGAVSAKIVLSFADT